MLRAIPNRKIIMPEKASSRVPDTPSIHVLDTDYDAIAALAIQAEQAQPEVAALLLAELARAEVHSHADLPPHTVAMHSMVEFFDKGRGAHRTVELVYPQEADIEAGKISILTLVGAALIGMAAGTSIMWPDREGRSRWLKIVDVRPRPVKTG